MITRRGDLIRVLLFVPLLVLAVIGRAALTVDVENLAMKSVGTESARVADLRAQEFGNDPYLILLASPLAPETLIPADERDVDAWVDGLRSRDEVTSIELAPVSNSGERCVMAAMRTSAEGRYAGSVDSLGAAARASLPAAYDLAISGYPAVEVAIAGELDRERTRILPMIVAVLALVLLAIYRSPVLAVGALLAPLTGVLLLEGVQGFLGLPIDPMSALLGPSVLTVGVASSVHVLERYRRALSTSASVQVASQAAARDLRAPFLLTMITTVVGFLGLLVSPIPAVRRFGLLAAVGVVLAIAVTLLCLPSLLRLMHRPAAQRRAAVPRSELAQVFALRRWSSWVIGSCLLVAATALNFAVDTRLDTNPLHVLSSQHPVRLDTERIGRQLGGSEIFELLLPPSASAGEAQIRALVAQEATLDGVVGLAGRPRTSEHGHALLSFLLASGDSDQREATFLAAEAAARLAGWENAAATGLAVRIARDSSELVTGQRKGILITLLGLWLVMAIGFRSVGLGLLGLVPNVLPLLLIHGGMAYAGQPLSVASSMIGTVMLGLVVDDTIHLVHAYRSARGSSVRKMARTFQSVRRPIVITSIVMALGFSVTLLGELHATKEFGGMAVATLLFALLADLVLMPALLLWPGRAAVSGV